MDEEIECIQAIYSNDGEFGVMSEGESRELLLNLQSCRPNDGATAPDLYRCECRFKLPVGYPNDLPTVSIHSNELHRQDISHLYLKLKSMSENLRGSPMLLELITTVKNYLDEMKPIQGKSLDSRKGGEISQENNSLALLRLDHMRSRLRYIKTIETWAKQLSLRTHLIVFNRLILLLIVGEATDVKEYIVRLKTQKVDIDSSGKPCKERMMTILCEEVIPHRVKRSDSWFNVIDISNREELRNVFKDEGHLHVYECHVRGLMK